VARRSVRKTVEEVEVECLDESTRYVDLAVRLRLLKSDNTPGELLPQIIGGRWDTWTGTWVHPRPADLACVEITVQEQQRQIVEGVGKDVRFLAIFAGRQAGKSNASQTELVLDALTHPGRDSFVVSLDFKASREPEESILALCGTTPKRGRKPTGPWQVRWHKSDRILEFPHGHRIIFRSAENIDSCRGPSTKTIVLEEGSRMEKSVFDAAVGCGVAASGSFRLIIPTTPRRECAWLRKVEAEWGSDAQGLSAIRRLRSADNPRADHALLERLRSEMDPDTYAQEFEGQLVPPEHAVWYFFKREVHLQVAGTLPQHLRFAWRDAPRDVTAEFCQQKFGVAASHILGWDFGQEATVWGKVYRFSRTGYFDKDRPHAVVTQSVDRLYVTGELVNRRTTTEHHALAVQAEVGTDVVVITDAMGWHDRSDGRGSSTAAPVKLLREAGFKKVVPVAEKNPEIPNTIRVAMRLLRDANQDTRCFFDPRKVPVLVDALENQERDDHGNIVKDGREHVIDAWRYLVWRCFPIVGELPEGFRRQQATRG
jgi:hypothetical protein